MTGAEARQKRLDLGVTQMDVAVEAGVTVRTVRNFELGCAQKRGPQRSTVAAIEGALRLLEEEIG